MKARSLPGILGRGTYSGSMARLNGTSVAAPHVVRALADEIAFGGSVDTLKAVVAPPEPSQGFFDKGYTPPPPKPDDPLRVGFRAGCRSDHRTARRTEIPAPAGHGVSKASAGPDPLEIGSEPGFLVTAALVVAPAAGCDQVG